MSTSPEMTASSPITSLISLWDQTVPSVHIRFPQLQGRLLQEKVMDSYTLRREVVPLFNAQGQKLMQRHSSNTRFQDTVRKLYAEGILQHGILSGVRSETIGIEIEGIYHLLAGATLTEALYLAHEMEPHNMQVQLSVSKGIPITVMHPRTPPDIQAFLRDLNNSLNQVAAKLSFSELYLLVAEVELQWAEHRRKAGLTARNCQEAAGAAQSYEGAYWKWVQELWPGKYSSWPEFDRCKVVRRRLESLGIWGEYCSWLSSHCLYASSELDNHSVLNMNYLVMNTVLKVNKPQYARALLLLLRFAVPSDDSIPWVLRVPQDQEKLKALLTPMATSKAFQLSRRAASKQVGAEASETASRKRARGKAKSQKPTTEVVQESIVTDDGSTREACFLDDLINAIEYTVERVAKPSQEVLDKAMLLGLEFCLCQHVEIPVQPKTKKNEDSAEGSAATARTKCVSWAVLRKYIKEMLRKAHALAPRLSDPDVISAHKSDVDDENAEDEEHSNQAGSVDEDASCEQPLVNCVLTSMAADPKLVQKLQAFLEGNDLDVDPDEFEKTHSACTRARSLLFKQLGSTDGRARSATTVLDSIGEVLWKSVDPTLMKFAQSVYELASKVDSGDGDGNASELDVFVSIHAKLSALVGVWRNLDSLERCLQLRTFYTVALVNAYIQWTQKKLSIENQGPAVSSLQIMVRFVFAAVADVSALDCHCASLADWKATWHKILERSNALSGKVFTPRTPDDWDRVVSVEQERYNKATVKDLRKLLCQAIAAGKADVATSAVEDVATLQKPQVVAILAQMSCQDLRVEEETLAGQWQEIVQEFVTESFAASKLEEPNHGDDAAFAAMIDKSIEEQAMLKAGSMVPIQKIMEARQSESAKAIVSHRIALHATDYIMREHYLSDGSDWRDTGLHKICWKVPKMKETPTPSDSPSSADADDASAHGAAAASAASSTAALAASPSFSGGTARLFSDFHVGESHDLPGGLSDIRLHLVGRVVATKVLATRKPMLEVGELPDSGHKLVVMSGLNSNAVESQAFVPGWCVRVLRDPNATPTMVLKTEKVLVPASPHGVPAFEIHRAYLTPNVAVFNTANSEDNIETEKDKMVELTRLPFLSEKQQGSVPATAATRKRRRGEHEDGASQSADASVDADTLPPSAKLPKSLVRHLLR